MLSRQDNQLVLPDAPSALKVLVSPELTYAICFEAAQADEYCSLAL